MSSYRVYKLPTGSQINVTLIALVVTTAGGLVFLGSGMSRSLWVPEILFAAAFLLAMAYALYRTVTSLVREIVLHLDGTIEFRATYRTSVLLPSNIRSFKIEPTETGNLRTATIEHAHGRVRLYAVTPEIVNDVVRYVTRGNSSVRVVEAKKSH